MSASSQDTSAFGLDPQLLGIYITVAATASLAVRYFWKTYIRPPSVTGYGKGAPGFITAGVRKAWVENPNPGRQIIERDDRHLYQPDAVGASSAVEAPPQHTTFSYRDRLAKEKEDAAAGKAKAKTSSNVDEDWLPQGIKSAGSGKKKVKGSK